MSKANSLKNKITNKTPAREFINAYARPEATQEEKKESKKQDAPIVSGKNKEIKSVNDIGIDNDVDSDSVNNINEASKNDSNHEVFSVIDNLLEKEKSKPVKEYVGFYLDADVHQGLNDLCKRSKQKGLKSKIVNDILRSVFEKQGIIKNR